MKSPRAQVWISAAALICAAAAHADDTGSDDRLLFSASGATLSGASGGGGGSAGWLHNFSADNLVGAAVEYDTLADAHWTFGSLNAATTSGPAGARLSLYGEIHEGAGDIGSHSFDYANEAVGLIRTFGAHFSLLLEDRQIDIDTSRGNLPKIGATMIWGPRLQTAVAFQHSVSGNLGTNLGSIRIDGYGKPLNWLVGAAYGQGAPAVFNLQTGLIEPNSGRLKEAFLGASKQLARSELTVVVDYLDLSGTRRTTLTVNYIFDLNAGGRPK
jgi:hypothetical protein